jgi:prephenate dehydrogenase
LEAQKLGVEFYPSFDTSRFFDDVDVIVLAVPLIALEDTIQSLPVHHLKGKLIVEMGVLNAHPKAVMLRAFGDLPDIDILAAHPMFGSCSGGGANTNMDDDPYTASTTWDGRPLIYEKVRVSNAARCEGFLKIFEDARCRMIEMNSEQHDATVADAEFVTHLTGRLLVDKKKLLPPTPVSSKEYAALCDVADMTLGDSFDLFFGMYKYNANAREHLHKMRENLANIERQLVAKESYLAASAELRHNDRKRLLAETKLLLREVVDNGGLYDDDKRVNQKDSASDTGTNTASPAASTSPAQLDVKEETKKATNAKKPK